MKFPISLLFLLLLTVHSKAQNPKLSGPLQHFTEVEQAPSTKNCEQDPSCTLAEIRSHVIQNLDRSVLDSIAADSVTVNLKFIVDTAGKVIWTRAQGNNDPFKQEGLKAIKALPALKPGVHKGEVANVLIDLPIRLKLKKTSMEEQPSLASYDTPPYLSECENEDSLLKCTSEKVQIFLMEKMRPYQNELDKGEHWIKISFDIDTSGKIININAKGNSKTFKKRAISFVEKLPDFVPATKDGEEVTSTLNFPIFARIY